MLVGMLMALLAVGLPTLQMQPGEFFLPRFSEQSNSSASFSWGDMSWFLLVVRGLMIVLLFLLPIYLVIGLLTKRGKRKLWGEMLKMIIPFLILLWISEFAGPLNQSDEQTGLQPGFLDFSSISGNATALPEFEANPQSWMLGLIIVGAAALVAGVTFYGLKSLSKREPMDDDPLWEFADKAQVALNDIEAAKIEFDDVIIRCYAEMSQTLQAEKGIQRAQAMTTHEFEQELLAKGFPAQPVQQLTRLFEQVRYGRQQHGEAAKRSATESLREIISFCRRRA